MYKFRASLSDGRTVSGNLPTAANAVTAVQQGMQKITEALKEKAGGITRITFQYVSGKESFKISDAPPAAKPAKK